MEQWAVSFAAFHLRRRDLLYSRQMGKVEFSPQSSVFTPEARMHGEYKTPGGKLVVVDYTVREGRLADVAVTGDFFLYPEEALDTITHALTGLPPNLPADEIAALIHMNVGDGVTFLGFSPEAIGIAVTRAMSDERAAYGQ
ncbi:MAG: hypothetical protein LC748_13365 [Thermomicrobia bacterium]|nr:hypothetical protein [Thermomicrobia bacterium]